jgi:putative ABC transport system ATP-binding protein
LVTKPSLLLADEPTGALDTKTGEEVMALFETLHQNGLTLIVVTHDVDVAARARRVITIRDGEILSDERRDLPKTRHNGVVHAPEMAQSKEIFHALV